MKITIYELLGLIKDGKDIPEKISYIDTDGFKYVFELENDKNYWCEELGGWLFNNWDIQLILNDEVEILDEEDEFIDIEEFKSFITNVGAVNESNIEEYIHILFKQQTALINNQKKIINKLKEEGK